MNIAKILGLHHLSKRPSVNQDDAVMFDIDNTLIDRNTHKSIKPMVELLNSSKQLGYKIVILTARPDYYENQVLTTSELKQHGIFYNTLGFCPAEKKSDTKKYLQLNFVLSVGDYWTDLTDSDEWIKLPDEQNHQFLTSIRH